MKHYEIMFIVRPTLSEDEIKKVVKDFQMILKNNGATVKTSDELGQKDLAYEINDYKSGYYFLFNVDAKDDTATKEFDRISRNSKDIIRHLITKIED